MILSGLHKYLLPSLSAFSLLIYIAIYSGWTGQITLFTAISLFNSLFYVIILYLLYKFEYGWRTIFLLLFFAVVLRFLLIFTPNISSDDIFRYLWDGKVSFNGINPYARQPEYFTGSPLDNTSLLNRVTFPELKTIYPPVSQYFFFMSYAMWGESITGFKFNVFLCEIISIILICLILKKLRLPEKYSLVYALCPLPIMQLMIDGHVDGAGLPFLLGTIYLYISGRKSSSYFFLGISFATKFFSGMILPFIFIMENGKERIKLIGIFAFTLLLVYSPFLSAGTDVLGSLNNYLINWTFNGSLFNISFHFTGNNQTARLITFTMFFIIYSALFFVKMNLYEKIYYSFLFFFLLAPTVYPWYLLWFAALLPFCFNLSGFAFVVMVNVTNLIFMRYVTCGLWKEDILLLWIEYLPVYILLFWEIYRRFISGQRVPHLESRSTI